MLNNKKKTYNTIFSIITALLILFCFIGINILKVKGYNESVNSDNVKALYVRADTAALRLEDKYVQIYKQYIEYLKEEEYEKANMLITDSGHISAFEKIIGLILATELNGVVINVKDDAGNVTIPSQSEYIKEIESYNGQLYDIDTKIEKLKNYGIYTIARVVVFKDDILSEKKEHSIKYDNGELWRDYSNFAWVNPYDKYVQQYNIEVAKQAAVTGFDEIQFDYVRFPEKFSQYEISKSYLEENIRQDELIRLFLKTAYSQLNPYNVKISADVFGCVAHLWDDPLNIDIGQIWYNLTQEVDYISPMVYPSHYRGTNWYTYSDPNKHPYEVVKGAIEDSLLINSAFKDRAKIRFWLQDFSMYEYEYGPMQILDQVKALHEKGIDTYMFWNNKNIYEPDNYLILESRTVADISNRYHVHQISRNNPVDAVKRYIDANISKNPYEIFILTAINNRDGEYKDFIANIKYLDIKSYEITDSRSSFNTAQVFLNVKTDTVSEKWVVFLILEQGIWKINGYYVIC